jgi:hypothetical protein
VTQASAPVPAPRFALARAVLVVVATVALAFALAGCGIGANGNPASFAAQSVGPDATVTGATAQTRGAIASALSSVAVQFGDATRPYLPPESGRLRVAPRAVYQVVLPDQPDAGYVVVYEFPDAAAAVDGGNEEAGFLGSGPARVSFPRDARHVLRQLGPTLILFTWSPSDADATAESQVAVALGTLGIGFTVPN